MGVISDAIDSLQEWCENLFKDGIKSQFDSISDLMTETFHKTTEDGGLISTFLTGHPASFSGSASGGTTIWSTIEIFCNNVVVPIGGFILVIILLNDLIQTVIRGNNCSLPRKTQKTDTQNEKNAPEHHVQERFLLPINGVLPLFYPFNFSSILATCRKICLSVSLLLVSFSVSSFGLSVVVVAFFANPFSPAALMIAG